MVANPFNHTFNVQIEVAESLTQNVWASYSNISLSFDTSALPEDPEDSFRKNLNLIRFDEEIWSTEE